MITNCNLPLFDEKHYPEQCPQLKLAQKYNQRLKELSALLQHVDEYIAERDKAKDEAAMSLTQIQRAPLIPSSRPTMAGFLNGSNS